MSFIRELNRRNVFRVAIAYVIVAWLILQVGDTLAPALLLEKWVNSALAFFLILGFPIALILAWAYEVTPEGLKKEKDVGPDRSISHDTRRKLDFIIIGCLVVALGYFAVDKYVIGSAPVPEQAQSTVTDNSIAVLAFTDLSPDGDQEYFCDGIAEELLNVLSKVPDLKVVARTSAFQFKGENRDVIDIGQKLRVGHILDGSIRIADDKMRISVQLIKADDGYHIWSNTYDRNYQDVFAVQTEIAAKVVDALKVNLLGSALTVPRTSTDAYSFYLRARYFDSLKGRGNWEKAVINYQQALAIDPDYAPAWAGLSVTYRYQVNVGLREFTEGMTLAREAVQRALELDENLAVAWGSLGQIEMLEAWNWQAAERAIQTALTLEPGNADVLSDAAGLATVVGRLDDAAALLRRALSLDPLSQSAQNGLGLSYMSAGRLDEAEAVFQRLIDLNPEYPWGLTNLARVQLLKGEPEAALTSLELGSGEFWRDLGVALALHDLGRHVEAEAELAALESKFANRGSFMIAAAYAWRGDKDRAFEWLQRSFRSHETGLMYVPRDPFFVKLHDDPRWTELLDGLGLPQ